MTALPALLDERSELADAPDAGAYMEAMLGRAVMWLAEVEKIEDVINHYPERSRYGIAATLEHRIDRAWKQYDYVNVSTWIHPANGTRLATMDVAFDNAAARAVIDLYRQQGVKVA